MRKNNKKCEKSSKNVLTLGFKAVKIKHVLRIS